jgi:DNA-binding NarL/FixJ family response regulator
LIRAIWSMRFVGWGKGNPCSPQERKILDLIAEGKTNRQIAEELFLAEKTVKNYVSNLLSKLEMSRRSEAAAYAARLQADRAKKYPPEEWSKAIS